MLLTERLAQVRAEVEALKSSFRVQSLRTGTFNANEGLNPRDRQIQFIKSREGQRQSRFLSNLIADTLQGRQPEYLLKEAMGLSDFPLLFGDNLYRQLIGNFAPWPITWPSWCRRMEVRDFRVMKMFMIEGGDSTLSAVKEHEPYPETSFVESKFEISVGKYGRRYGLSFEALINDDLNAFASRPQVMATGARRSEDLLATQMLCDVNGPHASFFTGGNGNLATGALTITNLQAAWKILREQTDQFGNPIYIDVVNLITGPGNEVAANNILKSTQLRINDGTGGGDASTFMYVENWMQGRLKLTINPYIPIVASNCATDPWFLVANPSDQTQRPAFMFAYLRGRSNPQLFVKDPDAISLGGGDSPVTEGDFDNDEINYKLRHIFGVAQGEPKMAVGSAG